MELTVEQALRQGIAAHKGGKLEEAERLYRAILGSHPKHADANHNLGVMAVSANKTDAALPLFKAALETNPKIEQFWFSYLDALIKEKQFEEAKKVLKKAEDTGVDKDKIAVFSQQLASEIEIPTPALSALNSLLENFQNGRHEVAEKLAVSLTREFPKHQFGWKVLGAILAQTGRKLEAVDANQKAVKLSPEDAEAYNNLGYILKELGRLDEAEASLRQAIILQSDFAEAHNNLGATLKEMDRLGEAEASYRQAIAMKPDYSEAYYNLSNTFKELGRLEQAEDSLRQTIVLRPDYAEAHYNLGNTLLKQGRIDEAEVSFRQVIALKSDFDGVHNNLGIALQKLGRLNEAEVSYTEAIVLKSDLDLALMNRGILLFEKGEFEASLRDLDMCNNEKTRTYSLVCLDALGRIEEVYNRIYKWSEMDESNINMAAFSSFIGAREKKYTAHKFCDNPIDFLHFSNISHHLENFNLFINEVINELDNVNTFWEPYDKATKKGFQSKLNLFKEPVNKISKLKSIIMNEINSYYEKLQHEKCSYIQKFPVEKNLRAWHVVLKEQGYQIPHNHPDGWLSGVVYLKVVPSLGKNEGGIEFSLNGRDYHSDESPTVMYQPELGDIILFPSSLHHRTVPFTSDMNRIIISFDLKVN